MNSRVRAGVAAGYLALCLIMGGASAAGAVANAVLQILALVLILLLLWTRRAELPDGSKPLLWLILLFLGYSAITLVPLPPAIWTALPYRGGIEEGLALLGVRSAWLPTSLAPSATVSSLLWLLPPAAMFLLVAGLPSEERRKISGTIIAIATASIILGVFQLMGGPNSALRFYSITNSASPVGFFANINHQATLLLCAIPCTAVIAARFATGRSRSKKGGGLIIAVAAALFLAAGIAAAGSIAGYGLFLPAAFASLLIYRRAVAGSIGVRWKIALVALLAAFLAAALMGPLNQQSLSQKFDHKPLNRGEIAKTTAAAAIDALPVGTGLGTFSSVYRRLEDPKDASNQYVNHAHNDYLEIILEMGVVGILLIIGFTIWWARHSISVWTTDFRGANLARAASLMIGIVLLHSLVDYPLRTSAIAAVFASACALLLPYVAPAQRRKPSDSAESEGLRHLEVV